MAAPGTAATGGDQWQRRDGCLLRGRSALSGVGVCPDQFFARDRGHLWQGGRWSAGGKVGLQARDPKIAERPAGAASTERRCRRAG